MANTIPDKVIKVGIINLNLLLQKYRPELDESLVNENNPPGWTGKYIPTENAGNLPTFDQLINACFHAMQDMMLFIKEHEQIKLNLFNLQKDSIGVHQVLMGSGISTDSMKDGVEVIMSRFKQSLDVVYKASTIHPHGLVKFQAAAREFVLRFLDPAKANELYGEARSSELPSDQATPKQEVNSKPTQGTDNPVGN